MGTFITGIIVFALIGVAVHKIYKDRKNGKGCGGCENCSCRPGCCPDSKTE